MSLAASTRRNLMAQKKQPRSPLKTRNQYAIRAHFRQAGAHQDQKKEKDKRGLEKEIEEELLDMEAEELPTLD